MNFENVLINGDTVSPKPDPHPVITKMAPALAHILDTLDTAPAGDGQLVISYSRDEYGWGVSCSAGELMSIAVDDDLLEAVRFVAEGMGYQP